MPKLVDNPRNDRRGILIASLCFVHCIAGPILLSFAGLSSLLSVSEKLEPLFLLGSAAMGVIALVPGYRKRHGRKSCLALFASGLLCLFLRHHVDLPVVPVDPIATAIGLTLIIGAHALNLQYSRRCECCDPLSQSGDIPDSALPHSQRGLHAPVHLETRARRSAPPSSIPSP
jgi:MerC mercury resistance protein